LIRVRVLIKGRWVLTRRNLERKQFHAKRKLGGSPQVSGKTVDGKLVIKGIYFVVSSIGLPLENVLEILQKENMVVDWLDYYDNVLNHGSKSSRIMERIHNSVNDIYGKDVGEEIIKRLQAYRSRDYNSGG
jgi:hypothetical protein